MRPLLLTLVCLLTIGCATPPVVESKPPKPPPLWQQPQVTGAIREPLDDPAPLCPADVRVYLQVEDLAGWRDYRHDDPLVEHIWQTIQVLHIPSTWQNAMSRLQLDSGGMADALFGRRTALVILRADRREIPIVLTRVADHVIDELPTAFAMQSLPASARVGPFRIYRVADDDATLTMAVGRRWWAITDGRHADHLRRLLCAVASGDTSLATADDVTELVNRLPASRDILLFARDPHRSARHALTVTRERRGATFDYVADMPEVAKIGKRYIQSNLVEFGPLPSATVSAVSINVMYRQKRVPGIVKMMVFPHSFRRHVLGRLSPPIIAFMTRVPGEQIRPNPGVAVPALGVAIRMKDRRVAHDLDRLVMGVHFFANLGELDLLRSLFGIKQIQATDATYRVADFGDAIAKRVEGSPFADLLQMPDTAGLTHVTFGTIGDWYVICSQEAAFKQCLAAFADPADHLTNTDDFRAFRFDDSHDQLLINGVMRISELAPMVHDAADFWKLTGMGERHGPYDAPLRWIADALRHRRAFYLQLWRDGETRLRGHMRVIGSP